MSTDDRTNEPSHEQPAADHAPAQRYEIRVREHLGSQWDAWFDGLTLTADDDGTTVICGPVVDQSALHGVLQKLRDLGITLLSLTSSASPTAIDQPQNHCTPTNHQSTGASS
ncbi:MAG: hypothetical protein ABIP03_00255 [Aquihabitans sp.]